MRFHVNDWLTATNVALPVGTLPSPPYFKAEFLKNNACFAIGSVRPVRLAIWLPLSGVKSRASCNVFFKAAQEYRIQ